MGTKKVNRKSSIKETGIAKPDRTCAVSKAHVSVGVWSKRIPKTAICEIQKSIAKILMPYVGVEEDRDTLQAEIDLVDRTDYERISTWPLRHDHKIDKSKPLEALRAYLDNADTAVRNTLMSASRADLAIRSLYHFVNTHLDLNQIQKLESGTGKKE